MNCCRTAPIALRCWRNCSSSKSFQLRIRYFIVAYCYWLLAKGSRIPILAGRFNCFIIMHFLMMVVLYLIMFSNLSLFDLIIINERLSLKQLKYYLWELHFFKFKHAYYKCCWFLGLHWKPLRLIFRFDAAKFNLRVLLPNFWKTSNDLNFYHLFF